MAVAPADMKSTFGCNNDTSSCFPMGGRKRDQDGNERGNGQQHCGHVIRYENGKLLVRLNNG